MMGPYLSFPERLEIAARSIVPYSILAGLFVLNIVSVPYPLSVFFKAPLLLIALYYWCVFRPTLLPAWLVFIGALAFDLLSGSLLIGSSAALMLAGRFVLLDQRRFLTGQGFIMIWIGFGAFTTAYHLLQWALYSTFKFQWFPPEGFLQSLIMGVVLFPIVYFILHLSNKILRDEV